MASLVTTTVTGTLTTTDDIILTGTRAIKNTTSAGVLTIQGGQSWPGGKIILGGGNAAGGDIKFYTGLSTATPTERMVITDGGSVGIGTTDPGSFLNLYSSEQRQFHWYAGTSPSGNNYVSTIGLGRDKGAASMFEIKYDSEGSEHAYISRLYTNAVLHFDKAGTDHMTIIADGNVGIGEAAPDQKLEVAGAIKSSGAYGLYAGRADTTWASFGTGVPTILLRGAADNSRAGAVQFKEYDGTDTAAIYSTDGTDGYGLVMAAYQGDMKFATGSLTGYKMTILSGGSVGIGTTDPAVNLEVSGTNPAFDLAQAGTSIFRTELDGANDVYQTVYGAGNQWILRTNGGTAALTINASQDATFGGKVYATEYDLPSGGVLDWANGDARITEGLSSNYSLSLQTYDGSSAMVTNIFLASGGSVGIGTTNPSELLHVDGGGYFEGDVVRDGGWHRGLEITTENANFASLYFGGQSTTKYSGIIWTSTTSGNTVSARGAQIYTINTSATNSDIKFDTNNAVGSSSPTTKMVIRGDGNVGIGTATPYRNAHIYQAADSDNFEGALQAGGTSASLGGYFGYNSTSSGRLTISSLNNSGGANAKIYLGFGLDGDGSPATEVMILTQGGSVGIGGVAAPGSEVDIEGSHTATNTGAPYGTGSTHINIKNTSDTDGNLAGVIFEGAVSSAYMGGMIMEMENHSSYHSKLHFATRNASSFDPRMTITKEGRVGIGTTDPTNNLVVYATGHQINFVTETDDHSGMRVKGAAAKDKYILFNDQCKMGYQHSTATLHFCRSGAFGDNHLVINSSGNVGIGTADPSQKLDVQGIGFFSTAGNTQVNNYYASLIINNTGTSTWSRLRFDRSGVERWGIGLGTDDRLRISNLFTGGTAASPNDNCFVIDNNGNIGINVSAPTSLLHVTGDLGNSAFLAYIYNSGTQSEDNGLNVQIASSGSSAQAFKVNTGGDSNSFIVAGDGDVGVGFTPSSFAQKFNVNGNTYISGSVGIGTTAPAHLLHLEGGTVKLRMKETGAETWDLYAAGSRWAVRMDDADKLAISDGGDVTLSDNLTLSSKITFSGGSNQYLEIGTNSIALKNSGGTVLWNSSSSGSGTVTSVATSGAITGGTITTSGTITHSTANGYKHIPADGADLKFLAYASAGTAEWAGGLLNYGDYALFAQRYDDGSSGGALSGGQWNTRILNTTVVNNYTTGSAWASLSSNKISLQAGTYYTRVWAVAYDIDEQQINLANVDTGNTLLLSAPMSTKGTSPSNPAVAMSEGTFAITVNGHEVIAYHWANTAETNTYGGGRPLEGGTQSPTAGIDYDYDTYVSVQIWRVA